MNQITRVLLVEKICADLYALAQKELEENAAYCAARKVEQTLQDRLDQCVKERKPLAVMLAVTNFAKTAGLLQPFEQFEALARPNFDKLLSEETSLAQDSEQNRRDLLKAREQVDDVFKAIEILSSTSVNSEMELQQALRSAVELVDRYLQRQSFLFQDAGKALKDVTELREDREKQHHSLRAALQTAGELKSPEPVLRADLKRLFDAAVNIIQRQEGRWADSVSSSHKLVTDAERLVFKYADSVGRVILLKGRLVAVAEDLTVQ